MDDTTKKSRLNLIATSVFILIYYLAEIKVTGISFLGITIESGRPVVLAYLVWLTWGYLYLRYFTYFVKEGAEETGRAIRESIAYYSALNILMKSASATLKDNPSIKKCAINLDFVKVIESYSSSIKFSFRCGLAYDNHHHTFQENDRKQYSIEWSTTQKTKSFVRSVFMHPEILEYIAPFVIGALPLFLLVAKGFQICRDYALL